MNVTTATTAFTLRDYQESLILSIYTQWRSHRRVMAQLPTGGGKTVCFGAIAREFLRRGEAVLIVAHREELIRQAADKVGAIAGIEPSIIKAGHRPDYTNPLQVASVQSLVNRLSYLEAVGLIVVDEAHHATAASYRKILEAFPDAYLLGVTATPVVPTGRGLGTYLTFSWPAPASKT